MGATGSGKTSGPGAALAHAYLAHGFGGLVLCAKPDERDRWEEWAIQHNRGDDLIIVNDLGDARFNFLEWEAARPGMGGGLTINVVALLDELSAAITRKGDSSSGDNKFFEDALHHMCMNLVELAGFARLQLSFTLFDALISSAPRSLAEAKSEQWQRESLCAQTIAEAEALLAKADPLMREDFEQCRKYWLIDFPTLSEKTRSIIVLSFSMLVQPFTTRPLRKLFSTDTNTQPEDTFNGKIIIVDLPVQTFRLAGRVANLAWKYCFQIAVLRRAEATQHDSEGGKIRPVFLWADEAQNFITDFDAEYQAVARSAFGCTVYLTQNRESLRRVLGNDDTVDSLLGNLQNKFFCQNSGETNEWAAKLLGERWEKIHSGGVSHETGSGHTSFQDQHRYYFEPAYFATLARGGDAYDKKVETVLYNGGKQFLNAKNEPVPYVVLRLRQR